MANILIRKFRPNDAKEVSEMIARTLLEINIEDYPRDFLENDIETMNEAFYKDRGKNSHFYVFIKNKKIVGTGAIDRHATKENCAVFYHIYVNPDFNGQGIGTTIVETLENDVYYLNATCVQVPALITAIPFYEKFGYTVKAGITSPNEDGTIMMEKFKTAKETISN